MNEERQWTTKHWVIHTDVDNHVDKLVKHPQIMEAAQLIKDGEVVAFPTETVYGLGANALSDQAVEKIFAAKGRPSDNPLIVHVASLKQLTGVVDNLSVTAQKCIQHFWPGPLTLVLPKGEQVCSKVTAGLDTVAVRMPQHPIALALIQAADLPIAAPSANSSGKPSPTEAKHVLEDLFGKIPGVIDGGLTGVGVESTVLDLTGHVPCILRPGSVTQDDLMDLLGEVVIDPAIAVSSKEGMQPRSPGMKYKHYAPQGELWLVRLSAEHALSAWQDLINSYRAKGIQVGLIVTATEAKVLNSDYTYIYSEERQLEALAQNLYSGLRAMDEHGIEIIFIQAVEEEGLGLAIMNRLLKAASGRMLTLT